jgi:hypothetical protein
MTTFMAPSSIGEALDRLTILQLKLDNIQDSRRKDVQVEYDDLMKLLEHYINLDKFHYDKLLEVNEIMWKIQDTLHSDKKMPMEEEHRLMKQLAVENQRRFRLKRTINQNLGSKHKEQKGYTGKSCFVLGHLGLGDHFFLNGAVRYLASYYDEVCVVVKKTNERNLRMLFLDEPSVSFYVIEQDNEISPAFGCDLQKFQNVVKRFTDIYLLGYHAVRPNVDDFPRSFYKDLHMDPAIMTSWASFSIKSESWIPEGPFIFYHNKASDATAPIQVDIEEMLVLNPAENMYPVGHKWHELAGNWVGKPILEYAECMQKAKSLLMIDSSFFCMALMMALKPEVWTRNKRSYKNIFPDLNEHVF